MTDGADEFYEFLRQIRTVDIDVGIEQGQTALVLHLLEHRLGTLPDEIVTQVRALNNEQLLSLAESLLDFAAPDDLTAWLVADAARRRRYIYPKKEVPPKPQRSDNGFIRMAEVAQAELVLRMLERRLGRVSAAALIQLRLMNEKQLCALGASLLDFTAPDDLTAWLAANLPPEYNDYQPSVSLEAQYANRQNVIFVTSLETAAQARLIEYVLQHKFGTLTAEQAESIEVLHSLQLLSLAESLLDFTTPADLTVWLAAQSPVENSMLPSL